MYFSENPILNILLVKSFTCWTEHVLSTWGLISKNKYMIKRFKKKKIKTKYVLVCDPHHWCRISAFTIKNNVNPTQSFFIFMISVFCNPPSISNNKETFAYF